MHKNLVVHGNELTPEMFEELFDRMLALYGGGGIDTGPLAEHRERLVESPELRKLLWRVVERPDDAEARAIGAQMRQVLFNLIPHPAPLSTSCAIAAAEVLQALPLSCAVCGVEMGEQPTVGHVEAGEGLSLSVSVFLVGEGEEGQPFTWHGPPCRSCEMSLLSKYVEQNKEETTS
jgi:hypothetical protein